MDLTTTYFLAIAVLLVLSGILGGSINFYLSEQSDDRRLKIWQHWIIGVGASFMVPLFLNMSSSNLVSEILTAGDLASKSAHLLVLGGFCLVASISSRAFITSMSQRILREAREAKEQAQLAQEDAAEAQATVEPFVEADVQFTGSLPEMGPADIGGAAAGGLDDNERRVACVIRDSRFTLRAFGGIRDDARLSDEQTHEALTALQVRGLVAERKTPKGFTKWYLTDQGRRIAAAL